MTATVEQKEARRAELQRLNVVQLAEFFKQGVPRSTWSTGMIEGILNFEYPNLITPPKTIAEIEAARQSSCSNQIG